MYRYVQTDENGFVKCYCDYEVKGVTIDTKIHPIPEKPKGNYNLYFIDNVFQWIETKTLE